MKPILKYLYQNSKNEKIKQIIIDSFNKNKYVRASVASNSNTPVSVLEYLSKDKISSYVRYLVAKNQNTSIHVLEKLSNDENYCIRNSVSENPNWKIENI